MMREVTKKWWRFYRCFKNG